MGAPLRVLILANTDPTSSIIFQAVCEDARIEVVGIGFTGTLTKSRTFFLGLVDVYRRTGFPYFAFQVFINGVFALKERLLLWLPFLRGRLFPNCFSLRLWAAERSIPTRTSTNFNSRAFLAWIEELNPDILFTRINQILHKPILEIAPHGCWCFHSSVLPQYGGIAAEFHAMRNGEETVGFTVMEMKEALDGGPIVAQSAFPIPEKGSLHTTVRYNNRRAAEVIDWAVTDLIAGTLQPHPQGRKEKSYYGWPTTNETGEFLAGKQRFITWSEAMAYLLE